MYYTYLNSFRTSLPPSSPRSNCLQIQPLTDVVRSTNFHIIIIIIHNYYYANTAFTPVILLGDRGTQV